MDYQKLDAALTMALNESPEGSLEIFIHTHTHLDAGATAVLKSLGINCVKANQEIFTATVSPDQISQLSAQPWVKFLRQSATLDVMRSPKLSLLSSHHNRFSTKLRRD
ncbi:hypothetical protein [Trichormus variabilis]|nr:MULTISPECIES: hypothetical protein [Nostocaceae]